MRTSDRNGKRYFALTLLISALIFSIQFITIAAAALIIYLLVRFGAVTFDSDSVMTNIGGVIICMLIVSNIVGCVVAYLSSRIPMGPLKNLIAQIDRLASGDFRARLRFGRLISRHPTFAQLTDSFNKMAAELENTEMLRGDFVDNFSHEFKTPIVSIAGFAKLLRRGNLTDAEREEYLKIIEDESLRLSYMATNVLELTRIENQTILRDTSKFNLSEQIRSSILLLANKWEKKDLGFSVDFGEHTIFANEELLKQVWINLIDNAIKFSDPGGVIAIDIAEARGEITVSITNTGEQIPDGSRERIFGKFYQGDSSHAAEGSGIGLAIVKKVVDLHGGTVSALSEGGKTTFTVVLPAIQPDVV